MGFIAWIVVGAIAGVLANELAGSRERPLALIALGIAAGLLGGLIATTVLNLGPANGFNVESVVIATVAAFAILLAVNLAMGSRGLRHG